MAQSTRLESDRLSYGVIDAARAIGVSPRTVENMISAGTLRAARIGRRRLVPRDELLRVLAENAGTRPAPVASAAGGVA